MRAIFITPQTGTGHPLVDQARILPGTDVVRMADAARKRVIFDRAAAPLQPSQQARACIVHQLELDRATGLLLNDKRATPDVSAADQIADLDLHDVTAAQLAVDREVEK